MKLKQERSKEEVAIPLYNKGLVGFHKLCNCSNRGESLAD
jgi:hypothetical protein